MHRALEIKQAGFSNPMPSLDSIMTESNTPSLPKPRPPHLLDGDSNGACWHDSVDESR